MITSDTVRSVMMQIFISRERSRDCLHVINIQVWLTDGMRGFVRLRGILTNHSMIGIMVGIGWAVTPGKYAGEETPRTFHFLYIRGGINGYYNLAGSSLVRVEETVRMALALYERNIPFILADAEEILRMVTGIDFIGIVPDYIFPRYCHSLFPKEERIIDFMNLDREYEDQIVSVASWYPVKLIYD